MYLKTKQQAGSSSFQRCPESLPRRRVTKFLHGSCTQRPKRVQSMQ
ncbi:hypothetical protein HMPREF9436_02433 [Faecalibacterium cf. prausnitzii KLE1255]|uniref:Uncharacterized protein n=1 Tax=Faecalibacterium cf. prausnitzii KLE1255 TaxID=748224 RepID=E2ZL77_9FIRM|nr:hypothetical protein HMPREF9436_02433 [Faecalibacterium cf. prausnitzii KLE1255]